MEFSTESPHLLTSWHCLRRRIAYLLRFSVHPVTVFVSLQIIWIAIVALWVFWFVEKKAELATLAQHVSQTDLLQFRDLSGGVFFLVLGFILLGILLAGVVILFVHGLLQGRFARAHSSFVSSVTHDLRSPLASLQLTVETLKKRSQKHNLSHELQDQLLDMGLADLARLSTYVDRILTSSRLDRGISVFDGPREKINLDEMIQKVTSNVRAMHGHRDRLRSRQDANSGGSQHSDTFCDDWILWDRSDLKMIETHAGALQQILENLLENAIKYSTCDTSETSKALQTPKVWVKISRASDITRDTRNKNAAPELLISVRDEGIGLDKKDKKRIFRMFHRSPMATMRAIPGSGLGLYIVKNAVHSLGGRIWVESKGRGCGATFFVSLPVLYL